MRNTLLFGFLLTLIVVACKKESAVKNNPLTNFDNTSQGVYKGVFIGSTGTILLYIHNGDSLVTAYINVDGFTDTLVSTTPYISGQSITDMFFQGSFSTMTFSVN